MKQHIGDFFLGIFGVIAMIVGVLFIPCLVLAGIYGMSSGISSVVPLETWSIFRFLAVMFVAVLVTGCWNIIRGFHGSPNL